MNNYENMKSAVRSSRHRTIVKKQEDYRRYVTLKNGRKVLDHDSEEAGKNAGVSSGIYKGFAGAPAYLDISYNELLKRAEENLSALVSEPEENNESFCEERVDHTCENDTTEMEAVVKKIDEYIDKIAKGEAERELSLISFYTGKEWLKSSGKGGEEDSLVTFLMITLGAKDKDGNSIDVERLTGWRGPAVNAYRIKNLKPFLRQTVQMLSDKKDSVPVVPGNKDIILSCRMTGLLVHEAIGHTAEADNIYSGSVAGKLLGKKICGEDINITDFANHYNGKELVVPIYYDDEGNEARDVEIVKAGVFNDIMTDNYTAEQFGRTPSGNARAACYHDQPLVRMRNTAMLPGTKEIDRIVESVEDGYFIVDGVSGQSDLSGTFIMVPSAVYEIKNGKIGKAVEPCRITGNCFDVLKSVSDISNRFDWYVGICAKEQEVVVSSGAPDIRCRLNIGKA